MSTVAKVDPHALAHPRAQLGLDVQIGPYAVIGEHVIIGDGTVVEGFAHIVGNTHIGANCHVFPYAVIGSPPQDLKYKGEKSFLLIGDNNIFREFTTVNPGTTQGSKTSVGNNNLFMAYSHIAHDCSVGSDNIFANTATLAGHVEVGSHVVIGGLVAVHQFCRLGDYSIIGGCSKVVQDIPPFSMNDGHPAKVCSVNVIGLKRGNFSLDTVKVLKQAFKILFFENHPFAHAKALVRKGLPQIEEVKLLLDFISTSKRGINRSCA